MSLAERWAAHLDDLRGRNRYRGLTLPAGVDFSSNDYLGYAKEAPRDATRGLASRSGLASRLLRGHHEVWEEVENRLAAWHGAEAALVMTSGYVANEGLLSTVIEHHDWVASDQYNHASIVDGLRLARAERFIYRHNDLDQLEGGLRTAQRSPGRQLFVVTESLFGMDGDATPLVELVKLAERYGAHVIIDEAHATGCFGPAGSGRVDEARLRPRVLATMHTGGKALAIPGAYICGSAALKELLINRCRHFIYTTALPPLVGHWWLEAIARVHGDDAARARLHRNAALFRQELARHKLHAAGEHYIVPLILKDDAGAVSAAHRLQQCGWDIRAIRPPSVPEGTARLRISVHADHDADTLVAVARAVAEIAREQPS